ncbi:MAG: BrnT family toxin [Planctomycetota bacterium]
MALLFEWDDQKSADNLRKHGVPFEEAATTFADPMSLTIDDPAHSENEDRFIIMATSLRGRLLVTAFTERGDQIRIISSRRASSPEQDQYEQRLQEP